MKQKPSISTITQTFSTRQEAECFIAEQKLGGKKRARHVGSKWFLVTNDNGLINCSLFFEMYRQQLRDQAKSEGWRPSELACALVEANKKASRMWHELQRNRTDK